MKVCNPKAIALSALIALGHLMLASSVSAADRSSMFFATPVKLSHNPSTTLSYGVKVSVDAAGNIDVIWADYDCQPVFPFECIGHVFFSRSVNGGATFSAPKDISNGGNPFAPQVVVDRKGNINAVWEEDQQILFSRSVDGGVSFTPPKVVSDFSGLAFDPEMAVDAAGNINLVWQTQDFLDPNAWNVSFSRSVDGGLHFSSVTGLCAPTEVCNWPKIAVDSSGGVDVAWAKALCNGCNYDVFFARSANGVPFSVGQKLSNSLEELVTTPELLVDDLGRINVVWSKATGASSGDVFYSRSTDKGASFSTRNLSNDSGRSYFPQVGIDASGALYVFWLDDTAHDVVFRRSPNGGASFSGPFNVGIAPGSLLGGVPYVAVSRDGYINLVSGDGTGISFVRSTNGGAAFTGPQDLSSGVGPAFFPQIITDAAGSVVASWFAEQGPVTNVFVDRGVSLDSLQNDIERLPRTAFKNGSHQRAITNALEEAGEAVDSGDHATAIFVLGNVLTHVNGCGLAADTNDWIVTCAQQARIRTSIEVMIAGLTE